jgi:hypothetical protein
MSIVEAKILCGPQKDLAITSKKIGLLFGAAKGFSTGWLTNPD